MALPSSQASSLTTPPPCPWGSDDHWSWRTTKPVKRQLPTPRRAGPTGSCSLFVAAGAPAALPQFLRAHSRPEYILPCARNREGQGGPRRRSTPPARAALARHSPVRPDARPSGFYPSGQRPPALPLSLQVNFVWMEALSWAMAQIETLGARGRRLCPATPGADTCL